MKPTNQIGFLLQHLSANLARQSDQVLQERLGIGFSQFKILNTLKSQPHIQQRVIAESLGQTEASISRQIKLMHDKGLLQTQVRPENRREHITTLTAKGERFSDEAIQVLNSYYVPMFAELSKRQQQHLLSALKQLHGHACQGTDACERLLDKTQQ